jgi:hypothetical protein
MRPRVKFVCQSSACRRESEIAIPTSGGTEQGSNPRCTCGTEMKRVYSKPAVRELFEAEAIQQLGDSWPPKRTGRSTD